MRKYLYKVVYTRLNDYGSISTASNGDLQSLWPHRGKHSVERFKLLPVARG
jgi:hypothetical protein